MEYTIFGVKYTWTRTRFPFWILLLIFRLDKGKEKRDYFVLFSSKKCWGYRNTLRLGFFLVHGLKWLKVKVMSRNLHVPTTCGIKENHIWKQQNVVEKPLGSWDQGKIKDVVYNTNYRGVIKVKEIIPFLSLFFPLSEIENIVKFPAVNHWYPKASAGNSCMAVVINWNNLIALIVLQWCLSTATLPS